MKNKGLQGADYLKAMLEWDAFSKAHPSFRPALEEALSELYELRERVKNDIVYCKDCKFLSISGPYGECSRCLWMVSPNDFCSRGKRGAE